MLRSVLINLGAMATLVGCAIYVPHVIGPALPAMERVVIQAMTAGFMLGWIGLMIAPTPPASANKVAWPISSPFVVWGGLVVLGAALWLWMPYEDEAMLLMHATMTFGTVTVYLLTAIEAAPSKTRVALAPLVLPIVLVAFFATHPSRFSLLMVFFSGTYAFTVSLLYRVVQTAVDTAYTARQTAEAALAQVAAERDAKTRFLESASHDLGQPLQAARLFFDQMLRSPSAPSRDAAARRVGWAFDATEQLLRRILEHLRLESGSVEAKVERLAVGPLIARVAEMNEPAARLAGVEITPMTSRLGARADPELLERTLGNLVGNALRHAKARRLLIGARPRGERVRLWVIDDGVGIPAADASRLFDDYVQGSNHGDEVRGGFGLGLASARRMTRLMGGEVAYDARWRNGSAFWIELPAASDKAG